MQPLPSIAKHAEKHKVRALKKYGQNFILDSSLCNKIVKYSNIHSKSMILEIGPGIGGLTRAILEHGSKALTVIEKDNRCMPILADIKAVFNHLNIIHGDAMEFDFQSFIKIREYNKIDIVSNLPYNIGTVLLIKWLKMHELIDTMTLMLQREVVDRICAQTHSKQYGRLSILCQLICATKKLFNVSSSSFYPQPKVMSSVVKLTPLNNAPQLDIIDKIGLITSLAFAQRRKMIKSTLKTIFYEYELEKCNILGTSRAEEISPQQYLLLAKRI